MQITNTLFKIGFITVGFYIQSFSVHAEDVPEVVNFTAEDIRKAAAEGNESEFERYILEQPDWLEEPDDNGWLAIHEAARGGHSNIMKAILDHPSTTQDYVNARYGSDGRGGNALWLAKESYGIDHPIVQYLKEHGFQSLAPLDSGDILEFTLGHLHFASRTGHRRRFDRYLAEQPFWLYEGDDMGWLPIHEAARGGQVEIIEAILDHVDESERSHMLHRRTGAEGDGGNALFWARQMQGSDHPVVHLLEKYSQEIRPMNSDHVVYFSASDIRRAAHYGDIENLKRYITEMPQFVNEMDHNGWFPHHEAAQGGQAEALKLILSVDAFDKQTLNMRTMRDEGPSALWLAKNAHGEDHPVVKILEDHGCLELAPTNNDEL